MGKVNYLMLSNGGEQKNIPLVIAIGPFYDDIIWFEQLLDFLSEIPELKLYIPRVLLHDGTEVEINVLHHMLASQFTAEVYDVQLAAESKLYELTTLDAHTHAMDKVKHFIAKEEQHMNLGLLNDEMYGILASQYAVFLPESLQADYKAYEQVFSEAVQQVLTTIKEEPQNLQSVVLLPIFVSRSVRHDTAPISYVTLSEYLHNKREAEEL